MTKNFYVIRSMIGVGFAAFILRFTDKFVYGF